MSFDTNQKKREVLQELVDAFNLYDANTDSSPMASIGTKKSGIDKKPDELAVEDYTVISKMAGISNDKMKSYKIGYAEGGAYVAQSILAAVAEGLAVKEANRLRELSSTYDLSEVEDLTQAILTIIDYKLKEFEANVIEEIVTNSATVTEASTLAEAILIISGEA